MKEVKAFKCDYCYRCFGRPVDATNHERKCRKGPHAKHCQTCVHGVSAIIMWNGYPDADLPIYAPWCDHFDKGMEDKPYFLECETTGGDPFPEREMPGTCFYYEYKGYAGWPKVEEKP